MKLGFWFKPFDCFTWTTLRVCRLLDGWEIFGFLLLNPEKQDNKSKLNLDPRLRVSLSKALYRLITVDANKVFCILIACQPLRRFCVFAKERNSFRFLLPLITILLFRQSPPFRPSRATVLHSVVAILIGTFYETFITSETVHPEPDDALSTLRELYLQTITG